MKEALLIILGLSVILFIVITIVRIVMAIFFLFMIRKYKYLISLIKPKDKKEDSYIPSSIDDIMYRDKDIEKKKKQELETQLKNVKRIPKVGDDSGLDYDLDRKEIVGIVKPVGKWTAMILGQKVSYLMQHAEQLKTQNDAGYWVNMIHAQEIAQGKHRGMG